MTTEIVLLNEIQLGRLEQRVKDGLHSFVDVGNALIEIREGKGYRVRGFKTFEIYCEKVFGFTDRHGRRMIAAAETAKAVQDVVGQTPASESVARELASVANDPLVIRRVADKLEKKKSSIATATAETMAEVVAAVTGKRKPEPKAPAAKPNGHAAAPMPAPAAYGTDNCPQCRTVPNSYTHGRNGWACGNCAQPVRLSVVGVILSTTPPKVRACSNCKKPLPPGMRICSSCGEVVR